MCPLADNRLHSSDSEVFHSTGPKYETVHTLFALNLSTEYVGGGRLKAYLPTVMSSIRRRCGVAANLASVVYKCRNLLTYTGVSRILN